MAKIRNVAIVLFDDVELLDFAGPLEVFSVTRYQERPPPFNVYTTAQAAGPVTTVNGLSVNPAYTLARCPRPDILLIPGGQGTRKQMDNLPLREWIVARAYEAELLLSVCTGALVLGKAGLLDGLAATTHHEAVALLKEVAPQADVRGDRRIVDNGKVILAAGISAGIDMALHVVERLLGHEVAAETAAYMEFDWRRHVQPVVEQ